MDGAILFSDILVPYGLGQDLRPGEGHGPRLPIRDESAVPVFDADAFHGRVGPIYETVSRSAMRPMGSR